MAFAKAKAQPGTQYVIGQLWTGQITHTFCGMCPYLAGETYNAKMIHLVPPYSNTLSYRYTCIRRSRSLAGEYDGFTPDILYRL